jgi:sulfhydrogenase subunit beta (sulfur reductase)
MCCQDEEVLMKTLAKKNLVDILKTWAEKYTVICPNKISHDETIFDTFNENTFTLDYTKPSLPPKSAYLPHSDTIFTFSNGEYKEVIAQPESLLFGIRSCDMTGILQSRSFMTKDLDDVFYRFRADNILTVVMACAGPQNETCFCTTTLSGPFANKGYDLQFYDMGDLFLVDIGSEKGSELTALPLFSDIDETSGLHKVQVFQSEAQKKIAVIPEVRDAMDMLKDGSVSDDLWESFGNKCIICGGCTFVCPTCTCFNVFDRQTGAGSGERIRTWDACLYGGFTKEASGHNPRATQGLRLKRRHEHKLLYFNDRDTNEGLCTCVGCGRCSDYCPVHIGTIEIVKAITQDRS